MTSRRPAIAEGQLSLHMQSPASAFDIDVTGFL
jgi:hypothetical protein